ncbi:MAG TPA: patatin-like phospholipase family protein [Gemmatimonadales bacterium]|jgi:NTE family protein
MKPERVVLVLSGGGMKTMAHLGVLRALEQAGIRPSGIVAVSAGAMVGAMIASGLPYDRMASMMTSLQSRDLAVLNRGALVIRGVGARSVLKPEALRALLSRILPARFDQLKIPFRIAVTDLDRGVLEVFGTAGRTDCPLPEAVYASMALPLYLPPAELNGRPYADGGILQVLPLDLVLPGEADLVVASDVGPSARAHPSWRTIAPPLIGLNDRALSIAMADQRSRTVAAWRADPSRPPLLLVEPAVDPYGTFSFDKTVDSIEAGYRAAHQMLEKRTVPRESR